MIVLETKQLTREEIAAAALQLVDIPYQHHGRDEVLGLDCAGVLVAAFRRCGIELREKLPINYRRLPPESHIRECLSMNFEEIKTAPAGITLEPGAIVHFRFNRDSEARHLGIATLNRDGENFDVVHALRVNQRVILEPLAGVLAHATIAGIHAWPNLRS